MAFSAGLQDRPIVLVGMMGAGKTTVGRVLAARLALPFRDSDAEIIAKSGMSVADLFASKGEAAFRERERKVVARLLSQPPAVIAAGGGAILDAGTRALMKARAVTVWIDADPRILAKRLQGKTDRPLLTGGDLLATLTRSADERRPVYAEADVHIRSDGLDVHTLASRIAAAVPSRSRAANEVRLA